MKKHYHSKNDENPNVQISKAMTYYLRHGAEKEGLKIRPDGYVLVDNLMEMPNIKSKNLTYAKLKEIVDYNDKKRFELAEFSDSNGKPQLFVRATQGHTIKTIEDDLLLTKIEDSSSFPVVVHGSFMKFWDPISKGGLKTMSRNHVHLAPGYPGEKEVLSGMRTNCNLFIEIDMDRAMKDGITFYLSKNNVILTAGIDGVIAPKYFKRVMDKNQKIIFEGKNEIEIEEEKKFEEGEIVNKSKDDSFDYLLVLDFEAQCDESENGEKKHLDVQEIIEFPVVPINVKEVKVENDMIFHHYIKPVKYPQLTKFCTSLTGITQDQVDKGVLIEEALELLHAHLTKHDILNKKWCFVTCGDWDLNQCLKNETRKKSIPLRKYLTRWINVKHVFQNEVKGASKKMGMTYMLDHFKLNLDGRHHSGIDDCKNISKVVLKLLETGAKISEKDVHEYKS